MKTQYTNILNRLDQIINDTANHIHDFIDSKTAFTRKRKLDAATLIKTTLNMQGNCLEKELLDAFEDNDKLMTVSAYVQQKSKLSPNCFYHILNEFNSSLFKVNRLNKRYRLFAIDGTDFNQAWNPKSKNIIGSASKEKSLCQVHLNSVYDLINNTYQDCVFQAKKKANERQAAVELLKGLDVGPFIVIMDRGYASFNMIENCNRLHNCFYIIRSKSGQSAIKEVAVLPDKECDFDVNCKVTSSTYYFMTHHKEENIHLVTHKKKHYKKNLSKKTRNSDWDFEDICQIKFRICKLKISDDGKEHWEILFTNLNRQEFPLSKMKALYHSRWGVETAFRKLKYDLGSVQFHSKQDRFIEMEILAHMIMFNVVSQINAQAYTPQKHCKHRYMINFKMACIIIQRKYRTSSTDRAFKQILVLLSHYTVPIRPDRKDKRKLKTKSPICFLYRVA